MLMLMSKCEPALRAPKQLPFMYIIALYRVSSLFSITDHMIFSRELFFRYLNNIYSLIHATV